MKVKLFDPCLAMDFDFHNVSQLLGEGVLQGLRRPLQSGGNVGSSSEHFIKSRGLFLDSAPGSKGRTDRKTEGGNRK